MNETIQALSSILYKMRIDYMRLEPLVLHGLLTTVDLKIGPFMIRISLLT